MHLQHSPYHASHVGSRFRLHDRLRFWDRVRRDGVVNIVPSKLIGHLYSQPIDAYHQGSREVTQNLHLTVWPLLTVGRCSRVCKAPNVLSAKK